MHKLNKTKKLALLKFYSWAPNSNDYPKQINYYNIWYTYRVFTRQISGNLVVYLIEITIFNVHLSIHEVKLKSAKNRIWYLIEDTATCNDIVGAIFLKYVYTECKQINFFKLNSKF